MPSRRSQARLNVGARLQEALFRERPGRLARMVAAGVGRAASARAHRAGPAMVRISDRAHVVVVGGLGIGGVGRSAIVTSLAERAMIRGLRVGVVGHGYGARRAGQVCVAPWRAFGDEASAMHARLGSAVPILIGDRAAGIQTLEAQVDLVLVDGGLHSANVPRHSTIVVVDATSSRNVLPAGPLRAPLSTLRSTDLVWLHKVDEPGARPLSRADVCSVVAIKRVTIGDVEVGADWLMNRQVVPLMAIGRPRSFLATLDRAGAVLAGAPRILQDHRRFRPADLAGIPPGSWLITTAKDEVRLPPETPRVAVVHIDVVAVEGDSTITRLLEPPCSA